MQDPAVRARNAPTKPTEEQRRDHESGGHAVYRNWCRACVAGRGRSDPHLMDEPAENKIPTLAIDYTYLTNRSDREEGASPILVTANSATGKITGHVFPSKGTAHSYPSEQLIRIKENTGVTKFVLKSDGEPAILDLKRDASTKARIRLGLDIIPAESPEYESPANGLAEAAAREVKAMARTLRFATEEKYGFSMEADHVLLPGWSRLAPR